MNVCLVAAGVDRWRGDGPRPPLPSLSIGLTLIWNHRRRLIDRRLAVPIRRMPGWNTAGILTSSGIGFIFFVIGAALRFKKQRKVEVNQVAMNLELVK